MTGYLYAALLLTSCAFVIVWGDPELRLALFVMVATSVATLINFRAGSGTFVEVQPWLVVSETVALGIVLHLAYRSKRFWPLMFVATQIATLLSVLAPLFGRGLVSYGLGMAQGIWAYPQVLILIWATVRGQNRRRRDEAHMSY